MYLYGSIWAVMLQCMFLTCNTEQRSIPNSMQCKYKKAQQTMTCDGKGGNFTFIPRPPSFVTSFQLLNVNLENMTKDTLRNLTFNKLTFMQLKMNNISHIGPDTLCAFKYLKVLEWKQDFLPLADLEIALQNLKCPLSYLEIDAENPDYDTFSASSIKHLTTLRTLHLHLMEMKVFNTLGLGQLKRLKTLDLDNNRLVSFVLEEEISKLEVLSLGQNDLTELPSLCQRNNTPVTPYIWYLVLNDNAVRQLDTSGVSCLKYLARIDLSQNRIEYLHPNAFAKLPALLELKLSKLCSLRLIDDLAFNSSSLTKLVFKENPILSVQRFHPKTLFAHTPNLTSLDMTSTKMDITTTELRDLLLTVPNIQNLTLQRTDIKGLPVGVFSRLHNLTRLTLSGNYFSGWHKDVFANATSIQHIFFDGCNIKIINESTFPLEFRLSVKEIDLANNPFTCTCDLLWFRTWMKEVMSNGSILFSQYPYRYECRSPNTSPLNLKDYNPTLESCTISQQFFVILIIVLSVCIVFTVAGLVSYRYRWYLLYWMSLMRRRRRKRQGQEEDPSVDVRFDGFISYSNSDWDWVSTELLGFLEGQLGLRLCEHSRDFKPGMYIVDNVIEAMETSRKTILVISNEYMKSDWCQFELQMALSSYLKNELEIVVILLEHVRSCHVTSSLRALMVSTTYIELSDDEEAKRLFRERIQRIMQD